MMDKNEGCARDSVKICSAQSYVKEEKGKLHVAKYSPVIVEHGDTDITLKAVTYDIIKDNSGKIIERRNSKTRKNEGLTH